MNEITLSNNLAQIELEINHHKQIAGQSIWEIGRRLNHVKEHDLAHGQFMEWVAKIGIDHSEANRMMKVAKELPNSDTWQNLSSRALYLIATLPDDEKQAQINRIEQGDNPTVRELQEVRRQLNQAKSDLEEKIAQNERLAAMALSKEEPQVVEKEVVKEVVPDDYEATKKLNNDLLDKNKKLANKIDTVERQLRVKEFEFKELQEDTSESLALKEAVEHLRADKQKLETSMSNLMTLSEMTLDFEDFFTHKMAPMRFKALIAGLGKDIQLDKIREILTLTDSWLTEMYKIVPDNGRTILEGEMIND